ncbi:MAG TPA: hypothetical protein VFW66_00540 [Gemmatimonadales bacterium]|nr:hypothetical protein [Gemmatimonadales bacterium]
MLTAAEALHVERRRRPRPSLRQQYDEYILQRIESYKNSIPRHELLRLGEEVAGELQSGSEGQFVLTEVLLLESVDAVIKRRLKLKPYRRWKEHVRSLRDAQREPTHWGLEPDSPIVALLRRVEPEDHAIVVGPGGEAAACLLAAHEMAITFMAGEIASVERIESRFEQEALAAEFDAFVVDFGTWLPPLPDDAALVVLDAAPLGALDPVTRAGLVAELQSRTGPKGVHVLIPGTRGLAPEALVSLYDGWGRETAGRPRRRGGSRGVVLGPPPIPAGSAAAPAAGSRAPASGLATG